MISYLQYLQFSPYFAQQDIEKEESRLKFFKSFDELPQKIKDLLASMVTAEKIMNIGQTFGLDEFDTEAIALAVRKIATGEIFVGDAANFIVNETELPYEQTKTLVGSIVSEIFPPALDEIYKVQSAKFPQRPETAPNTSRQPDPVQPGNPNVINLRNRQN